MAPLLVKNFHDLRQMFWSAKQPAAAADNTLAAGHTVLVIDDDAVLLELMYAVLSSAGFNVLTSTRGTKGLEMLHQATSQVHVVLLDYQMPVLTGAQLLPTVRRLAPTAKVLGCSGGAPEDLPPEFRDGVDKLLSKPFTRNDLIAAITALLAPDPARNAPRLPPRPLHATARFAPAPAAAISQPY